MSRLINFVNGYDGLVIEKGKGCELSNFTTHYSWMDFWGDEGVNSLGVDGAIVRGVFFEFLARGIPLHIPKMYCDPIKDELADMLADISGLDDAKVAFSNSGTEANETAIKLARLYWFKNGQPKRYNIVTMKDNFHGRTGFSLAASDSSDSPYHKEGFGPMPDGFYKFTSIDNLYDLFYGLYSQLHGNIAAITLATILGNNKIEIYNQEFYDGLAKFCKTSGTLMILDEVQVGMGRTGKMFAYEHFGIKPDIVTVGKGLACGMPLSATIARGEIAKAFTPGTHFNTLAGNTLACKISIEFVKWLEDNIHKIEKTGDFMQNKLLRLKFITNVYGKGMHLSFQIDFEKYGYDGFDFCNAAKKFGLLIVTHRKYGQIRFTPPLNITVIDVLNAINKLSATHEYLISKKE